MSTRLTGTAVCSPIQEALTRKLVTELNPMDNVMFEIMNEPYTARGADRLAAPHR